MSTIDNAVLQSQVETKIEVSIICLAYNHEKYIRHTLQGVVMQKTDFKYELIIHDDASVDSTAKIIKEYEEKYPDIIRPIYQCENRYSKNINITSEYIMPMVRGKYIAICEGDDYWNDEFKLQKQYDVLEKHDEFSLVTHLVKCCNEDGTENARTIPEAIYKIKSSGIIHEKKMAEFIWIKGGYPFHTSSYFYRRSVIEKIDRTKWTKRPRDIDTLKACMLSGEVYYINEAMSTRRLWSIGNWNTRLREQGLEGKIRLTIFDCETDIRFDAYTEYRYHKEIIASIIRKILIWAHIKPQVAKKFMLDNGIAFRDIKNVLPIKSKFKMGIKYYGFMRLTSLYIVINRLLDKFKKV